MTASSRLRRLALAVGLGVAVTAALGAGPAAADPAPVVSMGSLQTANGHVTGSLTVRSVTPAAVDPGTLTATVDGTSYPVTVTQAPAVNRRAMLVIDTSGSMGRTGMTTVRAAVRDYLATVPADVQVGVVSFASTAGVDLQPTTDHDAVARTVAGLASSGDTSLYAAVQAAIVPLTTGPANDRSMVLLSDGADTMSTDRVQARTQAVSALLAAGVRTTVVKFRTDDADAADALTALASGPGSALVSAYDSAAVVTAFQGAAKALESQVQFDIVVPTPLSGGHRVSVRGVAGGAPFAVDGQLTAPVAPVPTPAPTAHAEPRAQAVPAAVADLPAIRWTSLAIPVAGALLIALALGSLVFASVAPSLASRRESRVSSLTQYAPGVAAEGTPSATMSRAAISEALTAFGDRAMARGSATPRLVLLLDRAGWVLRPGEWLVLTILSTGVAGMLGGVLVGSMPAFGIVVGALVGLCAPWFALTFAAGRRAAKFDRLLPDLLSLVATSLASGFGLPAAIEGVARDAAEPAAAEFSRALAETRIGIDISDALDHVATRMGSTALAWTVTAIRVQREVGGALADTLRTTAGTLRERDAVQRQVRTLSAEGRLSAAILIVLPILVALYMMVVNYGYISLLWRSLIGLVMSASAVLLLVVGVLWMRRIVRIEV